MLPPYTRPAQPLMWYGQIRQNWAPYRQCGIEYTKLRLNKYRYNYMYNFAHLFVYTLCATNKQTNILLLLLIIIIITTTIMLYNKVEEELNPANDSCDTKKDYTQQKIAKLRIVLKERKRKQVDSI
jgi:hypothetical protein